ncbi:TPA: hypothetical protein EYO12_02565 [Candidatus Saccharibacteria bacterium]|nr:hypothetical protein [Candidatus Saccharibacteria bacterium]
MRHRLAQTLASIGITALLISSVPFPYFAKHVTAADIGDRSIELSSSTPSQLAVNHDYTFDLELGGNVGSIEFEYCSNSPIPSEPCTAPSGIDVTNASIDDQSGEADQPIADSFVVHPSTYNGTYTDNNYIVVNRVAAQNTTVATTSFDFGNLINPDTAGSHYVRIRTYDSTDGRITGNVVDQGGLAFALNTRFNIQAYVPPFLTFCVGTTILANDCGTATGFQLSFGELSSNTTKTGTSKFLAYTNAEFGYAVSVLGTTMTSGNNTITNMASPTASQTGTKQFGLNLRANTQPVVGLEPAGPGTATVASNYNTPNVYKFISGDTVAVSPIPSDRKTFTASYIVNIPENQPKGIYSTTLTYVATATF